MAYQAGDIVTIKVLSAAPSTALTSARVQAQPPVFGIIDTAAATHTVLWPDGNLQASIASTSIDAIVEPDAAEVTRLRGRVVRRKPTGSAVSDSSGYDGYVVQMYRRRDNDDVQTATLALVRTVEGFYFECPSADLQPINGR
jgi:hypothetical protein